MTTSLSLPPTTLALPDDLLWTDEYGWRAVEQTTQYTITGALLVEAAERQAGRPITLEGGPNWGWLTRAQLEQLRAWAALPAQAFDLVIRGETARSVAFDHAAGPIDARPVVPYADPAAGDFYIVRLRFLEL